MRSFCCDAIQILSFHSRSFPVWRSPFALPEVHGRPRDACVAGPTCLGGREAHHGVESPELWSHDILSMILYDRWWDFDVGTAGLETCEIHKHPWLRRCGLWVMVPARHLANINSDMDCQSLGLSFRAPLDGVHPGRSPVGQGEMELMDGLDSWWTLNRGNSVSLSSSRKLASASWNPSCFSKVLGWDGISNRLKLLS